MSNEQQYEMGDMEYSAPGVRHTRRTPSSKTLRPIQSRRRGKAPQSMNGIHRRRKRKMAW